MQRANNKQFTLRKLWKLDMYFCLCKSGIKLKKSYSSGHNFPQEISIIAASLKIPTALFQKV